PGGERELVAVIARQVDRDEARVARGERLHDRPGPVARAVVDEDDLVIVRRHLGGDGGEPRVELLETFLLVEAGHDDRKGGRRHSRSFVLAQGGERSTTL